MALDARGIPVVRKVVESSTAKAFPVMSDHTRIESGLTTGQARILLERHGPNRLTPDRRRPILLDWALRVVADPMVILLLIAGATYLFLRDHLDAAVTLAALIPISGVTLVLEGRAERALEQLKKLAAPTAIVWRDGRRHTIPAENLVPGDVVVLHEGDIIPADATLLEGSQLVVDESTLTGESHPIMKDAVNGDPRVFAGTILRAGRGTARVSATGTATRYGQIGRLMTKIPRPLTPLQRIIHHLMRQLAGGAFALCLSVAAVELARGGGWSAAVIAGVSLAIAAIPEEFPMVYTLYLALGAWQLAQARALVRRLPGVEALGATTVICADKTGTLTQGRVEVAALYTPAGFVRAGEPLSSGARDLLNEAILASEPNPYDPLEQAIVLFAASHHLEEPVLRSGTFAQDYPFDPVGKYKSHVWQQDGRGRISAKGSVEGVVSRSQVDEDTRNRALEANRLLADEGLRIIAVAGGPLADSAGDRVADERHLRLKGLIAFSDPLRTGVAEALRECRGAGIRLVMITGDHPVTAHAVAEGLGLPHDHTAPIATGDDLDRADEEQLAGLVRRVNIFARTRPEQKYDIVRALRAQGQVVAMTGDGVNDAPALREADVGVAMGRRGTEVAREAATIVLLDDNFATIVAAIREGRRIFENLRRAFLYLVAFHTPILLSALVVPLLGLPLLLLPLHLVWLELIVHPTASLTFQFDPAPPDLMRRPPRLPGGGLLTFGGFVAASTKGITLFGGALSLYMVGMGEGLPDPQARALALAVMILGQVWLVLSERSPESPLWTMRGTGNWTVIPILGSTLASLGVALYIPMVARLLRLAPLSLGECALVVTIATAATLWQEPLKKWWARQEPRGARNGMTDAG